MLWPVTNWLLTSLEKYWSDQVSSGMVHIKMGRGTCHHHLWKIFENCWIWGVNHLLGCILVCHPVRRNLMECFCLCSHIIKCLTQKIYMPSLDIYFCLISIEWPLVTSLHSFATWKWFLCSRHWPKYHSICLVSILPIELDILDLEGFLSIFLLLIYS